jgi:hypothetical protein
MSHNSRVRGASDAWASVLPSELAQLEANLAAGINAVDGSTHAPSSPIEIFGTGLNLTGPLLITKGGTLTTNPTSAAITFPTLTCADNDYVEIDPSNVNASRTVSTSCNVGRGFPTFAWVSRRENGGFQAYAPSYDLQDGLGQRVARAYVPLRAHTASTLSKVTVSFQVGWPHKGLPTTMPSVRVFRVDAFGNQTNLTSAAAGADANGYVYVQAPSAGVAAWNPNAGVQQLVVPCDQNNVVDTAAYDYAIELVEEQGLTGYPWQLLFTAETPVLLVATGNVATLSGFVTIDGVLTGAADTVLLANQEDQTTAGVWEVASGAWSRSPPLLYASGQDGFSQGMVIPVLGGKTLAGTLWQCASTIASWAPANGATKATDLLFLPPPDASNPTEGNGLFGHGIVWLGAQALFTAIPDMRAP